MTYATKYVMLALAATALIASSSVFAQGESVNADDFLRDNPKESVTSSTKTSITTPELSEVEKGVAQAKAELDYKEILAKKIALAKEMHKIRPTRHQVDSAVNRASLTIPPRERQYFVSAMSEMLNYNAIERISIDAMIETYTLVELSSMVEYFSRPEAISASNKMQIWAMKIQPEVVNMIDKAMMRIRTGQ